MKMFTLGPVEMYPSTKIVRDKGFIYFRTNEYGNIVKSTLKKVAKLLGCNKNSSIIYLANSGTGAMEATVENCINKNEKALVINGGAFGHRFCELLNYHEIPFDSIDLKWDEILTSDHLSKYNGQNYTHLFVNIHETHTGQLYNIKMLSDFCKTNNLYFIVDAISSFLADEFDMDKYNVDLTIISSQKGLCLSPGMSIIAFSQKMKERILNNTQKISSVYFDFKDYLKNIERGQTPYTPTVCIMYELQDMLNIIEQEGGKQARLAIIEEKCKYFRQKVKELGLKIPDYPKSNMLTPICFEDISAYDVFQVLKDKYQIFVNPCGGDLAHKLLRVSHIGNTNIKDIDDLLEKLSKAIEEVKNDRK